MTNTTMLKALEHGDLSGCRELNLSHSGLTELPTSLYGLADTLEFLDLSGNALTRLPDDFGVLNNLKVLFCSGNRFRRLPPALGDCPALRQLGFRRTGLREIPAESLPPMLRWLTLTDNDLDHLPDALGERPTLQKLMLAGNHLNALPESLSEASNLELMRLSANRFDRLPAWLAELPKLAWLAWAGNPFDRQIGPAPASIAWTDLELTSLLGEGASGQVYEAAWRTPGKAPQPVAVKLFKGSMTSDGSPERELAACLAAGDHPRLAGGLGRLSGHPEQRSGLVMPLLSAGWRPLAGPPSLESCSRDVYDAALHLDLEVALQIVTAVGEALIHLHDKGILHGDVYAHNTLWDGAAGEAVLSDFGAASFMPSGVERAGFQRIEVLAWGRLLGELLDRSSTTAQSAAIKALSAACQSPDVGARPDMKSAMADLKAFA